MRYRTAEIGKRSERNRLNRQSTFDCRLRSGVYPVIQPACACGTLLRKRAGRGKWQPPEQGYDFDEMGGRKMSAISASADTRSTDAPDGLRVLRDPAAVVAFYSRFSKAYEIWGHLVDGQVRRRMAALAAVTPGNIVLDVGCGDGALLEQLARANPGGRTVGIDLAPGMLARATRRLRRAQLDGAEVYRGDARELAFAEASVDVITCAYVLDILPDTEIAKALAEFRRILRRAGRSSSPMRDEDSDCTIVSPSCFTEAGCPSRLSAARSTGSRTLSTPNLSTCVRNTAPNFSSRPSSWSLPDDGAALSSADRPAYLVTGRPGRVGCDA